MMTLEIVGNKIIPIARMGYGDNLVCLCGPDTETYNGIVISKMPATIVNTTDELEQPMVLQFRTRRDVQLMIKDLQQLEEKYNYEL